MYSTLPDGTKIYYNVNGNEVEVDLSKPALVFLHGGPGLADHTLYVSFWTKLSENIQVVFMDMRGHGRSDGHTSPESWTLDQWGKDVYDFCQSLHIEHPIIVGFSFGGWVALSYALQFPNHARGLMLCHTEAKVDIETRKLAYARKAQLMGKDGKEISDTVQKMYEWQSGPITRELYINHCIPLYAQHPYSAGDFTRCIRNPEIWDVFGKKQYQFDFLSSLHLIETETFILTGELDPEHPPEFAEIMAQKLPNSKLVIIESAGVPAYRDKENETFNAISEQLNKWLALKPSLSISLR